LATRSRLRAIPRRESARAAYTTLLRTIVGQQVSFKAADAVWAKLEAGSW